MNEAVKRICEVLDGGGLEQDAVSEYLKSLADRLMSPRSRAGYISGLRTLSRVAEEVAQRIRASEEV